MAPQKTKAQTPVGKKIKKIRTQKKITLNQVANDTGCGIDYLKQVESGKEMPPVGTLIQISRALGIDSGLLLKTQQDNRAGRDRAYRKRTENYAYDSLTPNDENKHLKAFRIHIQADTAHQGVGYQHEGEEFVYVLSGRVQICVGDHDNQLGPGQALHFNSGIRHHIRNIGDQDAELLVVLYHP